MCISISHIEGLETVGETHASPTNNHEKKYNHSYYIVVQTYLITSSTFVLLNHNFLSVHDVNTLCEVIYTTASEVVNNC